MYLLLSPQFFLRKRAQNFDDFQSNNRSSCGEEQHLTAGCNLSGQLTLGKRMTSQSPEESDLPSPQPSTNKDFPSLSSLLSWSWRRSTAMNLLKCQLIILFFWTLSFPEMHAGKNRGNMRYYLNLRNWLRIVCVTFRQSGWRMLSAHWSMLVGFCHFILSGRRLHLSCKRRLCDQLVQHSPPT